MMTSTKKIGFQQNQCHDEIWSTERGMAYKLFKYKEIFITNGSQFLFFCSFMHLLNSKQSIQQYGWVNFSKPHSTSFDSKSFGDDTTYLFTSTFFNFLNKGSLESKKIGDTNYNFFGRTCSIMKSSWIHEINIPSITLCNFFNRRQGIKHGDFNLHDYALKFFYKK